MSGFTYSGVTSTCVIIRNILRKSFSISGTYFFYFCRKQNNNDNQKIFNSSNVSGSRSVIL
jgi:hypothetical protein